MMQSSGGIIDRAADFVGLLVLIIMFFAFLLVIAYFIIRRRGVGKLPAEDQGVMGVPFREASDFIKIDDIDDGMVIDENGQRFTACLECSGVDFYSMDAGEQLVVQNGFISVIRQFRGDVSFLQVPENVDMSYKVKQYEEILQRLEKELKTVVGQRNLLLDRADDYVRTGKQVPKQVKVELDDLEERMHALDFRHKHATEERDLALLMQSGQGGVERMRKFILFSWSDGGGVLNEALTGDDLRKKASQELSKMSSQLITGLQNARVTARRLSTTELVEQFRKQFHPVTGQAGDVELVTGYMESAEGPVLTDTYRKKLSDYKKSSVQDSVMSLFG